MAAQSDSELEQVIRSLFAMPVVQGLRVAEGGQYVTFLANLGEANEAYLWDVRAGTYRQLTDQANPVAHCLPGPSGRQAAILRDDDGNELYRISLVPLEGGQETLLTEDPIGWVQSLLWTPDGSALVVNGADDDDNFLATFNVTSRNLTKVFRSDRWLEGMDISPDGTVVALSASRSPDNKEDYDIALVPLNGGDEVAWLCTGSGDRDDNPRWSPDGRLLAFTVESNDRGYLVIWDAQTGESLARSELEGDVVSLNYWGPGGDWLDLVVEKEGANLLLRAHLENGLLRFERLAGGDEGSVHLSHRAGERIGLITSAIDRPNTELELRDLAMTAVDRLAVTQADLSLGRPTSVWIESPDGTKVQGWFVRAPEDGLARAAVVYLHGGPVTATRNSWRRDIQGLVLAGFDVLALNYRGSTGFGPAFRKAATLNLGVKDIEDVVAAGQWLRAQRGIDAQRVALMGASYGGFLTLWTMVRAAGAFRCAAALVPIVDWTRHYELADASFRYYGDYFFGGSPMQKAELYRDRSPSTWVERLQDPVLISAGRNDPRCPFPPIEDFVARAREHGKDVEFDIQETEGHGAGRKTSAIDREMTILRFLRAKLA